MLDIGFTPLMVTYVGFGAKTSRYFGAKTVSLAPYGHPRLTTPHLPGRLHLHSMMCTYSRMFTNLGAGWACCDAVGVM